MALVSIQRANRKPGRHDLGRLWKEKLGGLPLPLGVNAVRRDLGPDLCRRIDRVLRRSIQYSLQYRREAVEYSMQWGRGLDTNLADRFIGMYVNEWTLDYGPTGRRAVAELLQRGYEAKLVPQVDKLQFV